MATITESMCECCGETAKVRTIGVAETEKDGAVQVTSEPRAKFLCADGTTRHLPDGWWIFELTTFGDVHFVAEICDTCAKRFKGYIKRQLNRAIKSGAVPKVFAEAEPKRLKGKSKGTTA